MQHEITSRAPLPDAAGKLREAGYAKRLLPVYDRAAIRAGAARIKEWDYYLVANDHYAVALTIDDNGYMGLDSISFLHFDERWDKTKSPMRAFPMGRTGLPASSAAGDTVINRKYYALSFRHEEGARVLTFHMEDFLDGLPVSGRIRLTDEPEESMVICTPFEKPGHFYYNQKINCMRASGSVLVGGREYVFDPADSFGVLDWGAASGRITTPGTGAAPPGRWTVSRSAGTSAMASATPPPRARTCYSTVAGRTSSVRCSSTSPCGTGARTISARGRSRRTTGGLRWTSCRFSTAPPARM